MGFHLVWWYPFCLDGIYRVNLPSKIMDFSIPLWIVLDKTKEKAPDLSRASGCIQTTLDCLMVLRDLN
jgi:hypothetical protein